MVTMDHQQKMAYAESDGHMTDNVTWPQKVNVVTPKYLRVYVYIAVEDRWILVDHQQENITCVIKQNI